MHNLQDIALHHTKHYNFQRWTRSSKLFDRHTAGDLGDATKLKFEKKKENSKKYYDNKIQRTEKKEQIPIKQRQTLQYYS